jgi:hypothetical protein
MNLQVPHNAGILWLSKELLASQEGFRSTELEAIWSILIKVCILGVCTNNYQTNITPDFEWGISLMFSEIST